MTSSIFDSSSLESSFLRIVDSLGVIASMNGGIVFDPVLFFSTVLSSKKFWKGLGFWGFWIWSKMAECFGDSWSQDAKPQKRFSFQLPISVLWRDAREQSFVKSLGQGKVVLVRVFLGGSRWLGSSGLFLLTLRRRGFGRGVTCFWRGCGYTTTLFGVRLEPGGSLREEGLYFGLRNFQKVGDRGPRTGG